MANYFTSDLHHNHEKIIKYCNRPFANADEMTEVMVENHNKTVRHDNDITWFLGDFSFYKDKAQVEILLGRLRGRKFLILGNHDQSFHRDIGGWEKIFYRVVEQTFVPGTHPWTLSHFPHLSWNHSHRGSFHLHGHTHGKVPFDPKIRRLDVGVDSHEFRPWHQDEIVEKLNAVPLPVNEKREAT